jgi:sugar transferase EpsL
VKRAFDIVVAAIALIVFSPVIAIVAILVRVKLGSPVLFRQTRPGLNGTPFRLMKFRTMLDATDRDGKPLPDNQRITPFGRALRKTSLDELPQLVSVLTGKMSLVGPRPLLMEYLDRYTPRQARRHEVRPGITGWAQVCGRNLLDWPERFEHDVWYVENQSFWLDMKILAMTVRNVVRSEGVSAQGEATMTEFQGTPAPASGESSSDSNSV